jgi:hypothetical protein
MIMLSTPWSTPDIVAKLFRPDLEWFPVSQPPVLKDLSPEKTLRPKLLKSEKVLVVTQTGEYYIGYYQQWTDEPTATWWQNGQVAYTLQTTGPHRIRYWRYLKKDHPPIV